LPSTFFLPPCPTDVPASLAICIYCTFTTGLRTHTKWVFTEQIRSYVQTHIWFLLDNACNLLLLKLRTFAYEEI